METITVQIVVNESIEKVWDAYTKPEHITNWAFASDDWHAPRAENDVRIGGRFLTRMESKDGSAGFDFTGTYREVESYKKIAYAMNDKREVSVTFEEMGNSTAVTVVFDPENENPLEMQKSGWQAILDNFKKYVERL